MDTEDIDRFTSRTLRALHELPSVQRAAIVERILRDDAELYPFFDRTLFRGVAWFGLVGLAQMVSVTRKRLEHHAKQVPSCNADALHARISAQLDEIEHSDDPLGLHGKA